MKIAISGPSQLRSRLLDSRAQHPWELFAVKDAAELLDAHSYQCIQAYVCDATSVTSATIDALRKIKKSRHPMAAIALVDATDRLESGALQTSTFDLILNDHPNDKLLRDQCSAVIRLTNGLASDVVCSANVAIDLSRNSVLVAGKNLDMPRREFQVLELLFLNAGRTVTTGMFLDYLYGWEDLPNSRFIDVLVCKLRKRLFTAGASGDVIRTRRGFGYAIEGVTRNTIALAA